MKKGTRPPFKEMVLFESNDYLVINKPPHLATLEDRKEPHNVLALARGVEPMAQVCHRLDKDTSGVLAIARNPDAYRNLSIQFEHRLVTKVYHALVDGIHSFNKVIVDAPILSMTDGTVRISSKGKDARTEFTTLRAFAKHCLVECMPATGRTHQIRVHLRSLGAPITGDETYGGRPFFLSEIKRQFRVKKDTEEGPLMKRMALHAYALEFKGLQGEPVRVIAPYPRDFAVLLKQLENHSRK